MAKKKQSRKKLLTTLRQSLETGTPVQVQRSVEPEEGAFSESMQQMAKMGQ